MLKSVDYGSFLQSALEAKTQARCELTLLSPPIVSPLLPKTQKTVEILKLPGRPAIWKLSFCLGMGVVAHAFNASYLDRRIVEIQSQHWL